MKFVSFPVKAPWSADIVERLNAHQACGYLHPYTCGKCRADLTATTDGWVCQGSGEPCDYTQNWAHEPPALVWFVEMNPAKLFESQPEI
jgi:hypothetical protein